MPMRAQRWPWRITFLALTTKSPQRRSPPPTVRWPELRPSPCLRLASSAPVLAILPEMRPRGVRKGAAFLFLVPATHVSAVSLILPFAAAFANFPALHVESTDHR